MNKYRFCFFIKTFSANMGYFFKFIDTHIFLGQFTVGLKSEVLQFDMKWYNFIFCQNNHI